MPLSDREQKELEQMERVLAAEDPKLASTLRGVDVRGRQRRRAVIAGLAFVVGVVMLFSSVVITSIADNVVALIAVGGGGFVIMLISAYVAATSLQNAVNSGNTAASGGKGAQPEGADSGATVTRLPRRSRRPRRGSGGGGATSGSFMHRMEERWRRRREGGL